MHEMRRNETELDTINRQEKNRKHMHEMRRNETEYETNARQEKDRIYRQEARCSSTELKRLNNFREAVRYGPIFTCTVCDQDMFRQSVTVLTEKIKEELSEKSSELCKLVLTDKNPVDWNGVSTFLSVEHVDLKSKKEIFHPWQGKMACM